MHGSEVVVCPACVGTVHEKNKESDALAVIFGIVMAIIFAVLVMIELR
jgi:hypothetical protein